MGHISSLDYWFWRRKSDTGIILCMFKWFWWQISVFCKSKCLNEKGISREKWKSTKKEIKIHVHQPCHMSSLPTVLRQWEPSALPSLTMSLPTSPSFFYFVHSLPLRFLPPFQPALPQGPTHSMRRQGEEHDLTTLPEILPQQPPPPLTHTCKQKKNLPPPLLSYLCTTPPPALPLPLPLPAPLISSSSRATHTSSARP